jgi:hypothetical protein
MEPPSADEVRRATKATLLGVALGLVMLVLARGRR